MAPPNPQKGNLEPLSVSGALQVEPGRLSQPAEQVGRARPARAGQPGRLVPPGRPVGCFADGERGKSEGGRFEVGRDGEGLLGRLWSFQPTFRTSILIL